MKYKVSMCRHTWYIEAWVQQPFGSSGWPFCGGAGPAVSCTRETPVEAWNFQQIWRPALWMGNCLSIYTVLYTIAAQYSSVCFSFPLLGERFHPYMEKGWSVSQDQLGYTYVAHYQLFTAASMYITALWPVAVLTLTLTLGSCTLAIRLCGWDIIVQV